MSTVYPEELRDRRAGAYGRVSIAFSIGGAFEPEPMAALTCFVIALLLAVQTWRVGRKT